ncbi:ras-related and estrogen-regulated growth inhibitor-like [Amphiura filiformis]|uniref:ras-related and estrogen-regulated growth inhibitor-like n=1 Tax=Amphiura filiformis TaxID=82378 RepID=UPI003B214122
MSSSSTSSSSSPRLMQRKPSVKKLAHAPHQMPGFGKPFRVVVLGQAAVGKTALAVRFVTRRFIWDYDPTLEMIYRKHCFYHGEVSPIEFEILDTAGQEELTEDKLKWADAFIIVYSIMDRCSFEEVPRLKFLITHTKKSADPAVLIIANKNDMVYDRLVSTEEGTTLARNLSCSFVEISVKESYDDVVHAFDKLYNEHKNHKRALSDWIQSRRRSFRKRTSREKFDLDANPPKPRERGASYANTAVMFYPNSAPRRTKSTSASVDDGEGTDSTDEADSL